MRKPRWPLRPFTPVYRDLAWWSTPEGQRTLAAYMRAEWLLRANLTDEQRAQWLKQRWIRVTTRTHHVDISGSWGPNLRTTKRDSGYRRYYHVFTAIVAWPRPEQDNVLAVKLIVEGGGLTDLRRISCSPGGWIDGAATLRPLDRKVTLPKVTLDAPPPENRDGLPSVFPVRAVADAIIP